MTITNVSTFLEKACGSMAAGVNGDTGPTGLF